MKRIIIYIKKYRNLVIAAVAANVAMAVFQVASIPFLQLFLKILFGKSEAEKSPNPIAQKLPDYERWMTDWLQNLTLDLGRESALLVVCAVIVGLFLGKNLSRYAALYWIGPVRFGIVRDLRQKMMEKITSLPVAFFTERRKGDLVSRISADVMEVEWSILNVIESIAREPIALLGALGFMVFISPELTAFVLVLILFTGVIIGRLGSRLKRQSGDAQDRLGRLVSTVEETLGGLRIIQGFNAEKLQNERFLKENNAHRDLLIQIMRRRDLASPLSEFLGICVFVVLLIVGSRQVFAGTLAAETFITFLYAFFSVIDPAKNLSAASYNIQKGMAALDRVDSILNEKSDIVETLNALSINEFCEKIEFRGVSVKYQTAEKMALETIHLDIKKGQIVALVGPSGAGKSTLADLLPRFYDPTAGAVFLDGHDLRDLSLKSLRGLMGIVTQEAVLFNDSVLENIRFGDETASFEQIRAAAEAANALEFIENLPQKFDTNIGDRGSKLSGGQRQRLTIARALLKNPPILILDEATSALDSESEKLVQAALQKLMTGRTSLVIAHRLSTIQNADEIIVLDGGQIIEKGSHAELFARNGAYRKLVELQGT